MSEKLAYEIIDQRLPHGPNSGYLFAVSKLKDDLYFPNGQVRSVKTGIRLHVPKGKVVLLEGLYTNESTGLHVIPQRLSGPDVYVPQVIVRNDAGATKRLSQFDPIATLRVINIETKAVWHEVEPPPESERQEQEQDAANG